MSEFTAALKEIDINISQSGYKLNHVVLKVCMTPTYFDGKSGIGAALVNWRTQDKDIELVKKVLEESLNQVLKMSL